MKKVEWALQWLYEKHVWLDFCVSQNEATAKAMISVVENAVYTPVRLVRRETETVVKEEVVG